MRRDERLEALQDLARLGKLLCVRRLVSLQEQEEESAIPLGASRLCTS